MENFWALGLVLVVTAILHECSHGLACKYFGGQVREIGFLLIYFMPAFFCNISDAWLFPQKSRRLWVAFAGAYCELLLWALAVFCWRLFAEETLVHYLALIMIGSSGVRILLNFNPFIKLDGYYMLSDYLDIPNLRSKALQYLGYRFKALFRNTPELHVSQREKIIYLAYGILAGSFSLLILGYLASLLATFLIEQFQGTGFIIFIGIIMVIFWKKLQQLGFWISSQFKNNGNGTFDGKKWIKFGVPLGVIVLVSLLKVELTVSGEFEIQPLHNADIRAEIEAIIDEIHVKEGDLVHKGDLLVHLSDRDYLMQLHKIEAEIREHEAQLKMLTSGATQEKLPWRVAR
ncbi:biotin/lipoyl-binding protein [Methylomarinum vadi]|uniref:biotin/lipoyl-binding protein n=1 Tax=Methylomarinum vadi TaxID=438855 RepID=UPI00136408EA|nr:biotin/lipoyl-binding protein [Methylomarinum vadi]